MAEPVPSTVTKAYPRRGPLQQFRFAASTAFHCFRCGEAKKAKLMSVYDGDWSKRLCNGCYGYLLSIFEIKSSSAPDEERSEMLANVLLAAVAADEKRRIEELFKASDHRASLLCAEGLRFLATAEHIAEQLDAVPQLEWSPAVIGLCKAAEAEVVHRLLRPLSSSVAGLDLSVDKADKDLGRVATFCADATKKTPELGVFAHFLQTVIHSEQRRASSVLIGGFLKLSSSWTGSHWLLEETGLHKALTDLTAKYRNRAAHIDELGRGDYFACRDHVIGPEGLLWKLVVSTCTP